MQEMTRGAAGDLQAEALVHGYMTLHQEAPEYGGQRRRLRVHKMRGMPFRDGYHDFVIQTGGLEVYPRLDRRRTPGRPCRRGHRQRRDRARRAARRRH